MDPTPEQAEAIRLFSKGKSLAIEAGAGTGKTSTLVMIAKSAPGERGQYVAFNKALVEESKAKFPLHVACNTAHSLAFRAIGKNYAHRLNSSMRMTGAQLAGRLGIGYLEATDFQGKSKTLFPGYLAGLVGKTVTNFCQSADREITARHVPYIKGLDSMSSWSVREALVAPARSLWADLQSPSGWASFKHEHYLKMWQLGDPRINVDYILFDEAQDANPVIAAIVAAQEQNGCQLVYVGDSQQEIYAWTGAVNVLSTLQAEARSYLTQSFRFGQAIADRANEVLTAIEKAQAAEGNDAKVLRLSGNPAIDSKIERLDQPRAILVRTNAQGLTYLLKLQEAGRTAHFLGATSELISFAIGAQELQNFGRSAHPDLVCFDNWEAVRQYCAQDGGEDLRLQVRLIDNFGAEAMIKAINQMPNEAQAEVVISTAHKSKGREWDTVQLGPDFPEMGDSSTGDLRLLYVATTRAKLVLDNSAMSEGE